MNLETISEPIYLTARVNAGAQLHAVLKELRPLQRIVLHLRFWENREIAEIARLTRTRWSEIDHLIESTLLQLRPKLEKIEINCSKTNAAQFSKEFAIYGKHAK